MRGAETPNVQHRRTHVSLGVFLHDVDFSLCELGRSNMPISFPVIVSHMFYHVHLSISRPPNEMRMDGFLSTKLPLRRSVPSFLLCSLEWPHRCLIWFSLTLLSTNPTKAITAVSFPLKTVTEKWENEKGYGWSQMSSWNLADNTIEDRGKIISPKSLLSLENYLGCL